MRFKVVFYLPSQAPSSARRGALINLCYKEKQEKQTTHRTRLNHNLHLDQSAAPISEPEACGEKLLTPEGIPLFMAKLLSGTEPGSKPRHHAADHPR